MVEAVHWTKKRRIESKGERSKGDGGGGAVRGNHLWNGTRQEGTESGKLWPRGAGGLMTFLLGKYMNKGMGLSFEVRGLP